ncbi:MAG: phenylacetate--CoA ligase family protein [Bacteroidales bacterium]|nr:MAG: phenylacetate--CoA ligase family protein [Bacteroidales bacterium]
MISPVETWVAERTSLQGNLNPMTLRNWQIEKLNDLISYASENTKFYHGKLHSTRDITELPFTSPSDIAADPFAFLAIPQSLITRVTTLANSGTTHLKKRIFFSKADLERTIDFFAVGMSTMVRKGEKAQILISNRTENSLGSLLKESLSRIGVTSEILGAIKTVNVAIEVSKGADCLIGMPAELLYMSHAAPELRPSSVLLAADYIPQSVINSIKETWKCDVYMHYGHTEFGFGCAVDCDQHNGYHLRDADLIFEIIDFKTGKPAKIGDSGEIVITTLSNEAMPLIRYRTGNLSRFINTPCGCGSLLPRLGRIEGRIDSNITIGNGNSVSIHQLDEIISANPKVLGFYALLKHVGKRNILHLTIDASNYIDLTTLTAMLPPELNIEVSYSKADPFSHREKRRIHIGNSNNDVAK